MKPLLFFIFFISGILNAAVTVVEFDTVEQTERYQKLIAELRCLVCQNQNLADSNAELAVDLKNIVQQKILAGETDAAILQFMTERYGDFVLYRPPFKSNTLLLWAGPLIFLMLGLFILMVYVRKKKTRSANLSASEREKIRQLIDGQP